MGSAQVKVRNIFHMWNVEVLSSAIIPAPEECHVICGTNCKYGRAATVYTLETWFVSGI
jgi:hypothetical protein